MPQIDVKILDREFRLAVADEDRPRLLEAVRIVDEKMRSVRDAGRISGVDRIAVMAALQLAHEGLGAAVPGSSPSTGDVIRRIRRVNEEIDAELKRQEQLF